MKNKKCKNEILSLLKDYNCKIIVIQKIKLTEEKLKLHQPNLYKTEKELNNEVIFKRNQLIKKAMLNSDVELYILKRNQCHAICKQIKTYIRNKYCPKTIEEKEKNLYRNYMHSTINKTETENDIKILAPQFLNLLYETNDHIDLQYKQINK